MGKLKTTAEDFEENFSNVLNVMAKGETIFHALSQHKIDPSFIQWALADPQRKALYEQAQQIASETLAYKMLQLAEETPGPEEQYMVKVKQDIYKHLMSKWSHDRYGDRKQVEITNTVDIVAAMDAADLRLEQGRMIDVDSE